MKLGIFDSGIGGEAIANILRDALDGVEILVVNDREHLPYGSRSAEEIISLTGAAIKPLLDVNCDVIVIACNTATTIALPHLRELYPDQRFVGIEPMIKSAAGQTKSGVIAVCATPRTLESSRYAELKERHAPGTVIIEPDCHDWAYMIENGIVNREKIRLTIEDMLRNDADIIVLGCTHYHWIKDFIEQCTQGKAIVLEPSTAIVSRVSNLLDL